jgi:hypothetical protein
VGLDEALDGLLLPKLVLTVEIERATTGFAQAGDLFEWSHLPEERFRATMKDVGHP